MIYFIQPIGGGPIKIGTSTNVPMRVKTLETEFGRKFVLLATLEGGRDREKELHAQFSHLRFKRTEQFRPEADLLEFIGSAAAEATPDVRPMRPNEGKRTRHAIINIRCRPEWKAWLEEYAKFLGLSVGEAIDRAALGYAREHGLRMPPKR